uniref:Fucosyltransferase n=1 Tax=Haemonchus contortus TaxID=6289 RepID=A0A7I4YJN4_HAECO|nr:Glycosyl transferase domain containing protein [Haemonchus contortus]
MVRYWKASPKSQGGQWNSLKATTTAVMTLAVVSTIFFMYQDSQNVYFAEPQRIPIIVTWTPFFITDMKKVLLPTLNNCIYMCHLINRQEQHFYQRNVSAYVIHGRNMNSSDLPRATPNQLKVFMLMESPHHTGSAIYQVPRNFFNATMTYRRDSRYFLPYGQFVPLTPQDKEREDVAVSEQKVLDALKRKTRGSLIFVSNCNTRSKREHVIKQLGQFTDVTVRGACQKQLSSDNSTELICKSDCDDDSLIATHRFYISFENSLCKDYITEKFYKRISQLLVPVVMRRKLYEGTDIPPDSFIALDDFESVKQLGDYLNFLRTNDTEYLKYFEWIKHYRLPSSYISNALCKLCEDIYHNEKLEINDIARYYTHDQCMD